MVLKKSLLVSAVIILMSACGGGGTGDSKLENKSKEKQPPMYGNEGTGSSILDKNKTYDFVEYRFSSKVLKDDKTAVTHLKDFLYDENLKDWKKHLQVDVSFKDDKMANVINSYSSGFEDEDAKIDYKQIIKENGKETSTIKEDKIISYDEDLEEESERTTIFKRKIKVGDIIFEENVDGEKYACVLSNHFDKVSLKEKVKEYLNKDISMDKTYTDILEMSCEGAGEKHHNFIAKNTGFVFGTTIEDDEYSYSYIEKTDFYDK